MRIMLNGKNGEAYNVGNDEMISIKNIVQNL